MQQVKTQVETLQEKVTTQIEAEIANAKETVAALKGRIEGMAEFNALSGEQQEQVTRPFNEFDAAIERQKLVAVIRDTLRRFEETEYQQQLALMTRFCGSGSEESDTGNSESGTSDDNAETSTAQIDYVGLRALHVSYDKAWLADESDVEAYIEAIRNALLEAIKEGKRVNL